MKEVPMAPPRAGLTPFHNRSLCERIERDEIAAPPQICFMLLLHGHLFRNNLFMPSATEQRYASHRLLNAVDAATVLRDRNTCIGDLPRARLATQL
jgi:hypothetical protein